MVKPLWRIILSRLVCFQRRYYMLIYYMLVYYVLDSSRLLCYILVYSKYQYTIYYAISYTSISNTVPVLE